VGTSTRSWCWWTGTRPRRRRSWPGALQDHDRAWILGTRTSARLGADRFIRSAKTPACADYSPLLYPSGRLIQRDYTNKSFYDYYFHKGDDTKNPLDVKMTEGGRTVYGGGGITPDEKFEAASWIAWNWSSAAPGCSTSPGGTLARTVPAAEGLDADTAFLEEFHDYLLKHGTSFTESEFMQDRDWITRYLAREMYITAFNINESDRVFAQTDPEVAKAVDAMPKANALLETTKKIIVERMNAQRAAHR